MSHVTHGHTWHVRHLPNLQPCSLNAALPVLNTSSAFSHWQGCVSGAHTWVVILRVAAAALCMYSTTAHHRQPRRL